MKEGRVSYVPALGLVGVMALGFFAGRQSAPDRPAEPVANYRFRPASADRVSARSSHAKQGPGAGAEAVTSAMELREVFKRGGDKDAAQAALAKMNGTEISRLVHDLAAAQAATPGYSFMLEIQAACSRWAEVDPDAALKFVLSSKQGSFRNAAIPGMFLAIAKNDPDLARSKLSLIADVSLKKQIQSMILSSIRVTRPDEWLAAVKNDPEAQSYGTSSLVSEWAMDDPVATAARIKQLPKSMQSDAVATVAKIWAAKDRQAALNWAQSLSDSSLRERALGAVAGGIAATDPDAAMASLVSLDSSARRKGLASVFTTLKDLDFDAALAKASALSDPADRRLAMEIVSGGHESGIHYSDIYTDLSAEQLHAVIEKMPAGTARNSVLQRLAGELSSLSLSEAETTLAGFSQKDRVKIQKAMLERMAYSNPKGALELYRSIPPDQTERYTLSTICSYLARRDPETLLGMIKDGRNPEFQNEETLGSVYGALAQNDPEATSRMLATMPEGELRNSVVRSVASTWVQNDPDAAVAWMEGLKDKEKAHAAESILPLLARNDPQQAAGMFDEMLRASLADSSGSLMGVSSSIVSSWVVQDPEAAGRWAAELPEGNTRDYAIQSLVSTWSREDFDSASQWVERLPDGKQRDNGVQAIVQNMENRSPATAFSWAATIGDESRRMSCLSQVLYDWKRKNPDEARAAVNGLDLPQADRDRLLQFIK